MLLRFISLADIKGFLNDVKPALLSALEAEYEKNPFEVFLIDSPKLHTSVFLVMDNPCSLLFSRVLPWF